MPPEYCEFANKSEAYEECKKALKLEHPAIYDSLYEDITEEQEESKEGAKDKGKKGG